MCPCRGIIVRRGCERAQIPRLVALLLVTTNFLHGHPPAEFNLSAVPKSSFTAQSCGQSDPSVIRLAGAGNSSACGGLPRLLVLWLGWVLTHCHHPFRVTKSGCS
jgi:hypothetical protein